MTRQALTLGRHIVFVRGRGVNSYSGFQSWGPVSAVFLDVSPSVGTATATATATATNTPTATSTATPIATATATAGIGGTPSATAVASATAGASATAVPPSGTATATVTETPCAITFTDVSTEYFAEPVRYLACHGIISGYSNGDGTLSYRPNNPTTRGQMVKIMVNAFGVTQGTPRHAHVRGRAARAPVLPLHRSRRRRGHRQRLYLRRAGRTLPRRLLPPQ